MLYYMLNRLIKAYGLLLLHVVDGLRRASATVHALFNF
jgi:hypothetical protein